MKRLIPAAVIIVVLISLCVVSNIVVKNSCDKLSTDINAFCNKSISPDTLQKNWHKNKEKMFVFVNHHFLDDITLYLEQLIALETDMNSPEFITNRQNINTIISNVIEEQKLTPQSFY